MESYLISDLYDLVTPDGKITSLKSKDTTTLAATVRIQNISPAFIGFQLEKESVFFNIKSTLAQIGINGISIEYHLDFPNRSAEVKVHLTALSKIAILMFDYIKEGSYIGKLFAADERRIVRNPDYLLRMFHRSDRFGRPLLYLGDPQGRGDLVLEKKEGRLVASFELAKRHFDIRSFDQRFFAYTRKGPGKSFYENTLSSAAEPGMDGRGPAQSKA